jgi:hypothetical protein
MTASFTFHVAADQLALAPWLVVATDRFMSGWGMAKGTTSYAAWACRDEHEAKLVSEYLATRDEMMRVRVVYNAKRDYAPKRGLISVYDGASVRAVAWYRENQALMSASRAKDAARAAARVGGAA